MYAAFQTSGFQHNAYQIISVPGKPTGGGGKPAAATKADNGNWRRAYNEAMYHYQEQTQLERLRLEKKKAQQDLERNERKLIKLEEQRLEALADIKLQKKLIYIMQEINALRIVQRNLEHNILLLEEDEVIILLLASSFYA